jgi:hypothetical protein
MSKAKAQVSAQVIEAAIAEVAQGKTFTHLGYGVNRKGKGGFYFTTNKTRARVLIRNGFTDVKFIELPSAMTKEQILASEFVAQVQPAQSTEAVA